MLLRKVANGSGSLLAKWQSMHDLVAGAKMGTGTSKVGGQSPCLHGDTRRKSCACRRAMQSISLRSTEPVICLVHLVPFLKEFAKFFKTAKDRVVIWRADS